MHNYLDIVLSELNETMLSINEKEYNELIHDLMTKRRVIVVGVGRVLISLKAWVKRFKHLGIDINYLGSETEESVSEQDLVIVASSSGESIIPKNIAIISKNKTCKLFYIGCNKDSSVGVLADSRLVLKGKSKISSQTEFKSKQPMSSLFEQQLFLLGDVIALDIMHRKNITEQSIKYKHANLE